MICEIDFGIEPEPLQVDELGVASSRSISCFRIAIGNNDGDSVLPFGPRGQFAGGAGEGAIVFRFIANDQEIVRMTGAETGERAHRSGTVDAPIQQPLIEPLIGDGGLSAQCTSLFSLELMKATSGFLHVGGSRHQRF